MAANQELKVRCPSCGAKYRIPAKAVGQKLRCAKCNTAFRVTDPRADSHRSPSPSPSGPPRSKPTAEGETSRKRPPTEDDILRWLSEAGDDADHERRLEMSVDDSFAGMTPAGDSHSGVQGLASDESERHQDLPQTRRGSGQSDPDDLLMLRRT